jgi:hypothetical protein
MFVDLSHQLPGIARIAGILLAANCAGAFYQRFGGAPGVTPSWLRLLASPLKALDLAEGSRPG